MQTIETGQHFSSAFADWLPGKPRARAVLLSILLGGLALAAYFPSLHGGFIFDDNLLLTENALVKAPDGALRVWYTTDQPDYVPLTSTTLWLEWRIWGSDPTGYHVTNLLLHVAACLLIWTILRRLSIPGAYLAAVLFAIHPVNVESVAWVEQRKNSLSMLLFLLSILWYLPTIKPQAADNGRWTNHWYWLSLLAFLLAMFSKGSVSILPLVLLLIVWWQRGRITGGDLLRSAPFFLISVMLTPLIAWFVTHGSADAIRQATIVERLLGAGAVVWFYLAKAIVPIRLAFVYSQWKFGPANLLWWLPLLAALSITFALAWRRYTSRGAWAGSILFAWLFFCIALAPVLGFVDVGFMQYALVADHYQHIAIIAVVALAGAGWSAWQRHSKSPTLPLAVACAMVGALTMLTFHQSRLYADPISLYTASLQYTPDSYLLHSNLGVELSKAGRPQEALEHFEEALRENPTSAQIEYNLANALASTDQAQNAIEHYQAALVINPRYAAAYNNLAWLLATTSQVRFRDAPRAVELAKKALELNSNSVDTFNTLAIAEYRAGNWNDAIGWLEKSTQSNGGGNSFDCFFLAMAHFQLGHAAEAHRWYDKAVDWMEKNAPHNRDLIRFRAEAQQLLSDNSHSK